MDDNGTTNILSILGVDVYLSADGRTSSGMIDVVNKAMDFCINREDFVKIVNMADDLYVTVCGSTPLCGDMQSYVSEMMTSNNTTSVETVALWANDYLRDRSKFAKDKLGEKPKEEDVILMKQWKKKYLKWFNRFHNTLSFIVGFDEQENPKGYLANERYELPLDISKYYTKEQIKNGMDKSQIISAEDRSVPHHFVRGSHSRGVTTYMDNSEFFKRISDAFRGGMDPNAQQRFVEDLGFDQISLNYALAILQASIHDAYTGGNITVKRISRGGRSMTFQWNTVKLYLEQFNSFEKDKVYLIMIERKVYGKETHQQILNYFLRLQNCLKVTGFHAMGFLKGYVLFRLPLKADIDSMGEESVSENIKAKSSGKGSFGMWTIDTPNFRMLVGPPTNGTLKNLLDLSSSHVYLDTEELH